MVRFAIACAGVMAAGLAGAAPPLDAYGRLPVIDNVQVSPDGTKVALVTGAGESRQVRITDLATRKPIVASAVGKGKIRGLQWAGSDALIVTSSSATTVAGLAGGKREWDQAIVYSLKTKRWRPMMENVDGGMNVTLGRPTTFVDHGRLCAVVPGVTFVGNQGALTLIRVDLEHGFTTSVEVGTSDTDKFVVDKDGHALARSDYAERTGRWSLWLKRSGGWTRNRTLTELIDHAELEGMGRTPGTILVRDAVDGVTVRYEVSLTTGTWSAPLENGDADVLLRDPASGAVIGNIDVGLEWPVYRFLASADQAAWNRIERAFPKETVSLASWSEDRNVVLVTVEGPASGNSLFAVDLKAKKADWLGNLYAGIEPGDTGEQRPISYKAADGMALNAYLTLPPGKSTAKGLPLVVLPHGGPAARDEPGFYWWAQAFASRGYAVLQPQFRGSSGYEHGLLEAGYGQWGRKMQTDLSDGVRALAAAGTIDPKRVCIAGASYGGYAALAGAAFDGGVYRCAASLAGPSHLRKLLAWEADQRDGSRNDTLRYWNRFMGAASRSDPKLDDISPALHADKVTIPVLLIHGQDDTVVAYEQSRIMQAALQRAGKPVEFVTLKGEDHWLSREATRQQMLAAMVAFVEKYNPPDKVTASLGN